MKRPTRTRTTSKTRMRRKTKKRKLSDEELKEIGDRIERFVTSQIPYLRKFIVRNWNQSGKYQSALDPGRRKPLEFVNDEEKAAFIPFCVKQLYRVPLRHPAYEGETDALTCVAIDYLNGMRWECSMVMGHCYVLGPGGNGDHLREGCGYLSRLVEYRFQLCSERNPGLASRKRRHRLLLIARKSYPSGQTNRTDFFWAESGAVNKTECLTIGQI